LHWHNLRNYASNKYNLKENFCVLFNSEEFVLGFLPIVFAGFLGSGYVGGSRAARVWLILASLYFYAWWNPPFVALLLASIVINYALAKRIYSTAPNRTWLVLGLALNIGLLASFKYVGFFASILGLQNPVSHIFLPLGISFFTFQQIMFIVDTYRGEATEASFLDYACFISFFPHLIAGPIVRPKHIIPQFNSLMPLESWSARLSYGLEIFLLGLAKKLILADGLAGFADPGFAAAARHFPVTLVEAWVALLAYALQIYFDFSGYSDMAIGLAHIFGIHFPKNFRSPYKATSISDFWKRWNITLSEFLRDYLYIPLGGNRSGEGRRILNVMVTMVLGGLWHGAGWQFLLWGGLHGGFLVLHGWSKRIGLFIPMTLSRVLTLLAVLFAWVPFRSSNLPASLEFYRGLIGLNGLSLPQRLFTQMPWLTHIAKAVPVLPYLGNVRAVSLPQGVLLLMFGWMIVLALPDAHSLSRTGRSLALIGSFAFTIQALCFAPFTVPFLYFQF
jgi:D-alanyl-lipoteichoic acid acyltransferase DltB (MBOAT superfamily)